jgi:hypothetical protein
MKGIAGLGEAVTGVHKRLRGTTGSFEAGRAMPLTLLLVL